MVDRVTVTNVRGTFDSSRGPDFSRAQESEERARALQRQAEQEAAFFRQQISASQQAALGAQQQAQAAQVGSQRAGPVQIPTQQLRSRLSVAAQERISESERLYQAAENRLQELQRQRDDELALAEAQRQEAIRNYNEAFASFSSDIERENARRQAEFNARGAPGIAPTTGAPSSERRFVVTTSEGTREFGSQTEANAFVQREIDRVRVANTRSLATAVPTPSESFLRGRPEPIAAEPPSKFQTMPGQFAQVNYPDFVKRYGELIGGNAVRGVQAASEQAATGREKAESVFGKGSLEATAFTTLFGASEPLFAAAGTVRGFGEAGKIGFGAGADVIGLGSGFREKRFELLGQRFSAQDVSGLVTEASVTGKVVSGASRSAQKALTEAALKQTTTRVVQIGTPVTREVSPGVFQTKFTGTGAGQTNTLFIERTPNTAFSRTILGKTNLDRAFVGTQTVRTVPGGTATVEFRGQLVGVGRGVQPAPVPVKVGGPVVVEPIRSGALPVEQGTVLRATLGQEPFQTARATGVLGGEVGTKPFSAQFNETVFQKQLLNIDKSTARIAQTKTLPTGGEFKQPESFFTRVKQTPVKEQIGIRFKGTPTKSPFPVSPASVSDDALKAAEIRKLIERAPTKPPKTVSFVPKPTAFTGIEGSAVQLGQTSGERVLQRLRVAPITFQESIAPSVQAASAKAAAKAFPAQLAQKPVGAFVLLPGVSVKPVTTQAATPKTAGITIQKPKVTPRTITLERENVVIPIQAPTVGVDILELPKLDIAQVSLTAPSVALTTIETPAFKPPITPTPAFAPTAFPRPIRGPPAGFGFAGGFPTTPRPFGRPVVPGGGQGEDVFVKTKKRFAKVNKNNLSLEPRDARKFGQYVVDNSTAKTFTTRKSTKPVANLDRMLADLDFKFRQNKRGDFVEQNRFGIDTVGEKRGLAAARVAAQLNKAVKPKGGVKNAFVVRQRRKTTFF